MKLLTEETEFNNTIKLVPKEGEYNNPVIFHCFWSGVLCKKHLISIISCFNFNVKNTNNKIVLWIENNIKKKYNLEILKYAEIINFNYQEELKCLGYKDDIKFGYKNRLTEYSDFIRLLLLYNYGGCWFDLDCFFLKSFDPIFYKYSEEICVYQWEKCNYPNNAITISLNRKSEKLKHIIDFLHNQKTGWRTSKNLTYSTNIDYLVLPCSWFDGSWIKNPYNVSWDNFFDKCDKKYTFDNFFKGSFCYHWHNRYDKPIKNNSIIDQLYKIIKSNLSSTVNK